VAVTWPDGSVTGSVRVVPVPAPVEPEVIEPVVEALPGKKKESDDGNR